MLAVIGVFSSLVKNPLDFLKGIGIMILTVAVIYFIVMRLYKPSPDRREQRAFVKAAKRSVKRQKSNRPATTKTKPAHNPAATFQKLRIRKNNQSNPNLTVIEGKKGKKKNRASF